MKKYQGKLRLAIIGAGGIAGVHIRGMNAHKNLVECVALCDVSDENIKLRSEQLGYAPAAFKDWKKMLADAGDTMDAVLICLPHHLHTAAILDAAAAGKHILCEKPMCTSVADADRIQAAIKKSGVTYMSAHNQLFMPVVQEARKMIEEGRIGDIIWVKSQDCFRTDKTAFDGKWRANAKLQGGGELIDTGYHPTYRMLHLAGSRAVAVRGSLGRFNVPIEGEDTASVQIRFASGALGEILTSWAFANPWGTHQIHVIGTKGQVFGSANILHYLPDGFAQPAVLNLKPADQFAAQMEHFVQCLQNGTRPLHSVEEGRAVLEIILEAMKNGGGWEAGAVDKAASNKEGK